MTLNPYLTPYTEVNSKWIKDLNVKPGTINSWNIGNEPLRIDHGNDVLDLTARAKINKWDYIKLKSFWTAKQPSRK